jgi:tyrosine-protein phosphatase SIW14
MLHVKHLVALGLVLSAIACGGAPDNASGAAPPDSTGEVSEEALSAAPIANFHKVRAGLYRGGHPDAAGLDYLKKLGVKRIVNLEVGDFVEAFPWDITDELDEAHARGLTELRYPMSAFEPAVSGEFDRHMTQILALLKTATPSNAIYVHCKHGQDRTGLVLGLERVIDEKWAPKAAHDEMLKLGFHSFFLGLNHYFEEKTGWEG